MLAFLRNFMLTLLKSTIGNALVCIALWYFYLVIDHNDPFVSSPYFYSVPIIITIFVLFVASSLDYGSSYEYWKKRIEMGKPGINVTKLRFSTITNLLFAIISLIGIILYSADILIAPTEKSRFLWIFISIFTYQFIYFIGQNRNISAKSCKKCKKAYCFEKKDLLKSETKLEKEIREAAKTERIAYVDKTYGINGVRHENIDVVGFETKTITKVVNTYKYKCAYCGHEEIKTETKKTAESDWE